MAKTSVGKGKKKLAAYVILDMTGSMQPRRTITLSAFNEYLKGLQNGKDTKTGTLTLQVFNSLVGVKTLVSGNIGELKPLDGEYKPEGATPLYDAIGVTIQKAEAEKSGLKPLIVIQTDGEENASREFTKEKIIQLVQEKQKDGWQFVFLGCDLDAMAVGMTFGIAAGNTLSYNNRTTAAAYGNLARGTQVYAASASASDRFFH